ncbi:MAG: metal ABC transporter permease [Saprospirales bacterium]|nr:metal ABC transporter permease [Saprospirales bacterium]MBK7336444.1 metal ABC transporter permease [Saprospirales bacterium]
MNNLLQFLSLSDPNVRMVVLGATLLGAGAGLVGVFTLLRKRALLGDAVAHSILPGVCLAFMVGQSKNPFVLLLGALIAGWLSLLAMDYLVRRTKLKADGVIGLVLSVFFGLGIWLLTIIQQSGAASQSGLDKFLFGKAASITSQDVNMFTWVVLGLVLVLLLFYKGFKLIAFDQDFARSVGMPVRLLEFLLSTITVLSIAVGIQAVGVVLMASLLIAPAAAARYWTDRLSVMLLLAAGMGIIAAWSGAYVSFAAPSMPTGPWIVMALALLTGISILWAPKRGILGRSLRQWRYARKIALENVLKILFQLEERSGMAGKGYSRVSILEHREIEPGPLNMVLRRLKRKAWATEINSLWRLTEEGLTEARQIVRRHRLWELYLHERLNLPADHVHPGAEAMEHLLTPELEEALQRDLGYPVTDPHQSPIP